MADKTAWGGWVRDEYNFRAGVGTSMTTADASATIWLEGYAQSNQTSMSYGQAVLEHAVDGGSWVNDATLTGVSLQPGESKTVASARSFSVPRVYGSTRTVTCQHWFSSPGSSDADYVAGGRAQITYTVPARPYSKPRAPKSVACGRSGGSDSRVVVSWAADCDPASGAQPWTGVRVYRKADGETGWTLKGTVGSDEDSWTDATTAAGHRYAYSVRSYNSAGETAASDVTAWTTPTAPAGLGVTNYGSGRYAFKATAGANWAYTVASVEWQTQTDGGGWTAWCRTQPGAATSQWTVAAGSRMKVRLRACGSGGLTSAWFAYDGYLYGTCLAPKSATATRSSDSKAVVTWTLPANAAYGVTGWRVQRSVDGSSTWASVASGNGTGTSWTDATTGADHRYQWRVQLYNGLSSSAWSASQVVYMTPARPTSVTAAASGTTAATVAVRVASAATASKVTVQHKVGSSGTWGDEETASLSGTSASVSMVAAAGTNYYRARAVSPTGLASAWVESSGIQTMVAPSAPAVTVSQAVYGADATTHEAVAAITWTPNHPDGSAQTKAQVELVDASGAATTVDVSGTTTSHSPSLAVGEWMARVRTHGAHADWGAWSGYSTFRVCDYPVVSLTAPGTVDKLPFEVSWSVTDANGVAAQAVAFATSGTTAWGAAQGTDARSVTVDGSEWMPSNGTAYDVTVTVTNGVGLASTAMGTVRTAWAGPALPHVEVSGVDRETGGVTMTVRYGSEEGLEDTDHVDVYRDGVLIAQGVADGGSFTDRLPPLNEDYTMEFVSWSATGATNSSTVGGFRNDLPGYAFNFGDAAEVALVECRNAFSEGGGATRQSSAYHFADGGESGGLPTAYTLGSVDGELSVGFKTLGLDEYKAALKVARSHHVGWVRDPYGDRMRALVEWSWSRDNPQVVTWTAKCTRLVWEEPRYV